MKQTAAEWLTEKLRTEFGFAFSNNILVQAKEIEKQQIIDAYQQGYNNAYFANPLNKEQYYEETFNK